jgi:hypothetical protein
MREIIIFLPRENRKEHLDLDVIAQVMMLSDACENRFQMRGSQIHKWD